MATQAQKIISSVYLSYKASFAKNPGLYNRFFMSVNLQLHPLKYQYSGHLYYQNLTVSNSSKLQGLKAKK